MKQCIVFMVVMAFVLTLPAQNTLPEFGNIDKQELLMKECPLDPTAPAMVLGDQGKVTFSYDDSRTVNTFSGGSMRTDRNDRSTFFTERSVRTRVKVFSDKGLSLADIKIYYIDDNQYEQVNDIAGYVYNLNEQGEIVTSKLEKDQVFRKKENNNASSVSFSLPGVKPGCVFEYTYTVKKKSYSRIDPWVFQRDVPTRISTFEIEIPEMLKFAMQLKANGDSRPAKSQDDYMKAVSGTRNNAQMRFFRHKYTLQNIEGLKFEPYMAGFRNNLQRLTFQLSEIQYSPSDIQSVNTSWESLAGDLDESEHFGYQLRKNVSISELDAGLKKLSTNQEKIEYIHGYMRKNYEWNGIRDFYCLNVKKISEQRSGSTGDLNLLLLNLLLGNSIEAWPVLVSTRNNGAVFKNYPFLNQFNSLVILAKAGEKFYVLDGADKYTSSHMIPPDVMGTEGLIVNKLASDWITLWDANMIEKQNVTFMANISADGIFSGDAYITSGGYARPEHLRQMKAGMEKYFSSYLNQGTTGLKVEDYTAQNTDNDTLNLIEKFKFSYKMNSSGDYTYFTMNLFTGLAENPFIAEKRFSDIDFGYNRRLTLTTRIVLPENFKVEALPKVFPITMPNSDIVFTPEYSHEDNIIMLRMRLEINKPAFSVAEYGGLKEFYKNMFAMLNEQVVLKKK